MKVYYDNHQTNDNVNSKIFRLKMLKFIASYNHTRVYLSNGTGLSPNY